MRKCNCSERPYGIVDSKVIMRESVPYQVLYLACTNKKCGKYKNVAIEKYVNLFDNTDVFEIEI